MRETERLRLLPWTGAATRSSSGRRPSGRSTASAPGAAVEKDTGRWIGRVALNRLDDWPGPDKWEVGFELMPEFWDRGYATEGAREAIRYGFAEIGLDRIISVTEATHRASRRVMEKCGLVLEGEIEFRETPVVWYAIGR